MVPHFCVVEDAQTVSVAQDTQTYLNRRSICYKLNKELRKVYVGCCYEHVGYKMSDGGRKEFQHRCSEHIPFHHHSS